MRPVRTSIAAAAIAGSVMVGGAAGVTLFGPRLAGAQTSTTKPGSSGGAQNGPTFKSNEDPTHEAGESAAREAAEDSGQFRGMHGSNEDPTHEARESATREAAENDAKSGFSSQAPSTGPSTTQPSPSPGSAT